MFPSIRRSPIWTSPDRVRVASALASSASIGNAASGASVRCLSGEGDRELLSFGTRDEGSRRLHTQTSEAPGRLPARSEKLQIRCQNGGDVDVDFPCLGDPRVDPRVEDRYPVDLDRPSGEGCVLLGPSRGRTLGLRMRGPDLEDRPSDAYLGKRHAAPRQLGQVDGCQRAPAAQRAESTSR